MKLTFLRALKGLLETMQSLAPTVGPSHLRTGYRAEQEAIFHLRRLGYTVVANRWTSPFVPGDIDLLAWDGPTLVVFEVKSRSTRDMASAESAIDAVKVQQLQRLARSWLRQLPVQHRNRVSVRYDALSVYLLPSGVEFEHLRDIL